jgi:hypothetical protein
MWHGLCPIPVQMWSSCAQSRCRCGMGLCPVPVQMWRNGCAQSRCSCGPRHNARAQHERARAGGKRSAAQTGPTTCRSARIVRSESAAARGSRSSACAQWCRPVARPAALPVVPHASRVFSRTNTSAGRTLILARSRREAAAERSRAAAARLARTVRVCVRVRVCLCECVRAHLQVCAFVCACVPCECDASALPPCRADFGRRRRPRCRRWLPLPEIQRPT